MSCTEEIQIEVKLSDLVSFFSTDTDTDTETETDTDTDTDTDVKREGSPILVTFSAPETQTGKQWPEILHTRSWFSGSIKFSPQCSSHTEKEKRQEANMSSFTTPHVLIATSECIVRSFLRQLLQYQNLAANVLHPYICFHFSPSSMALISLS